MACAPMACAPMAVPWDVVMDVVANIMRAAVGHRGVAHLPARAAIAASMAVASAMGRQIPRRRDALDAAAAGTGTVIVIGRSGRGCMPQNRYLFVCLFVCLLWGGLCVYARLVNQCWTRTRCRVAAASELISCRHRRHRRRHRRHRRRRHRRRHRRHRHRRRVRRRLWFRVWRLGTVRR